MAYKVIFRSDATTTGDHALTWEPGCPLCIQALQVSRDTETAQAFLQARVQNISAELVSSFKLVCTVAYLDGSYGKVEVYPLDADITAGASYDIKPLELERGDISHVTARIKLTITPAHEWKEAGAADPLPQPKMLSEQLGDIERNERKALLAEHAGNEFADRMLDHSVAIHDGWWVCPCGQLNVQRDSCCKCGVKREQLEHFEDANYLAISAHKRAKREKEEGERREKELKEQKAAEAEARKRNKKRLIVGGIAATVVIIAFAVYSFYMGAIGFSTSRDTLKGVWRGVEITVDGKTTSHSDEFFYYRGLSDSAIFYLDEYALDVLDIRGLDNLKSSLAGRYKEQIDYDSDSVSPIDIPGISNPCALNLQSSGPLSGETQLVISFTEDGHDYSLTYVRES